MSESESKLLHGKLAPTLQTCTETQGSDSKVFQELPLFNMHPNDHAPHKPLWNEAKKEKETLLLFWIAYIISLDYSSMPLQRFSHLLC